MTFLFEAVDAKATLVVIPGGEGRRGIKPEWTADHGYFSKYHFNVMLRSLSDPTVTSGRFNVVIFDSPTDLPTANHWSAARASTDHLSRVEDVVRHYQKKFGKPVWVMGHSMGTISITEFYKRLQDRKSENLVAGLIFSGGENGASFNYETTKLPVLVLHHENDECVGNTPGNAKNIHARLSEAGNTAAELVFIKSGTRSPDSNNPCRSGYHMYFGAGADVAKVLDQFMNKHLPQDRGGLAQRLAAPHRTAGNVARDGFRHPLEVLTFFGVKDDSTVVEILPGSGGYYMEILAPYLKDKGLYIAANRDGAAAPQYLADHQKLLARLRAEPALYEKVLVTQFNADLHQIAPPGSADFVLTFRNLHNWMERNEIDGALRAFHKALKPGGVLGVVDHRGRTDIPQDAQMKTGYVRQDIAVALIEKAGFKLAGAAEINANPKDTKDHPEGVWTLPPTYRLKDKDRAKYEAIGESDRFTLKFVKQ